VVVNKYLIYRWIRVVLLIIFATLFVFLTLDRIFPVDTELSYSQIVLADDGTLLHSFLNEDDRWRMKTELEEITSQLKKTIIFKEDKYFYYHFGINPISIAKAFVKNTYRGRRVSGASTISMQVARLLEPKSRTYRNKIMEMFRAIQLEWHFSKKEILQLYLNLVPYGGNIEGVKSASYLYFEQPPEALSLAQITTLSIIPNDPARLRIGQNNSYITSVRNKWLDYFRKKKLFDPRQIEDALEEPLTAYRHQSAKLIPHLANRIHFEIPSKAIVNTFIRISHQEQIEEIINNNSQRLKLKGINNAAVLVIDNNSMAVTAYVGSNNYLDVDHQGQVDGVKAVRSPGSTLKPFLYALAFDKGIYTPKIKISDIPVNFGGYSPENYDESYNGMITIESALALSLNVPAVKILNEFGNDNYLEYLIGSGFSTIENTRDNLGLSVILGGCGVKLEELTRLYTTFAKNGVIYPIRYYKDQSEISGDTLFCPASAYMITEILTQLKRPDLPNDFEHAMNLPKIAWKTGTSYGRRDAWSIGYNRNYTIGVWIGNFPGNGVPELNGSDFAAPLLFRIFNYLDNSKDWFSETDDLDVRWVCSESGMPPNDFCEDLIMDYYIPGRSISKRCQHLKQYFVDPDQNISYCRSCLPSKDFMLLWYNNYTSDLISFYSEYNIPYNEVPPHNPGCQRVFGDNGPVITSLTEDSEYILFKNENQQLKLACQAEADVNRVYWYINDEYYGSFPIEEGAFFTPSAGKIKISCTDDKGRNTDMWVYVRYI